MKREILLGIGLFVAQFCTGQTAVDLDAYGPDFLITAPQGFEQADYTFGPVPPGEGTNGNGLSIQVTEGNALTLFLPTVPVGPGLVHVRCSVRTDGADAAVAVAALNAPEGGTLADVDGTMVSNQFANASPFVDHWGYLDAIVNPSGNAVIPVIQAVGKSSQEVAVFFDEIVVTPLHDLGSEQTNDWIDPRRDSAGGSAFQQTILDLDALPEGALVAPPSSFEPGEYVFGDLPPAPTQTEAVASDVGLTLSLDTGEALTFYGPPTAVGPGLIHLRCRVQVDSPDVRLALAALNVPSGGTFSDMDGTMTTNEWADGEPFVGRWGELDTIIDPEGDGVVPVLQAVSTGTTPVNVYFDSIVVTPMGDLSPEEIRDLLKPDYEPSDAAPTPVPTPVPTAQPTPGADEIVLSPKEVNMLAGDSRAFRVFDPRGVGVEWVYKVDGVAGGTDDVGYIQNSPGSFELGIYKAPQVTKVMSVTITAVDPDDESRSASSTVTVYPLIGEFVLQPGATTVALGGEIQFSAGLMVEQIGFVPFKDVYWKVNKQLQGNDLVGRIDITGKYRAPREMPEPLPMDISVGFSLSKGQDPLKTAPVTLARLVVAPATFASINEGPIGVIQATLEKSDNTKTPVPAGDLSFTSDVPGAATVDAAGQVSIGKETGRAIITTRHLALGAADTTTVFSRSDVRLIANLTLLTKHDARIVRDAEENVTEIEFTSPGAKFVLIPEVVILRGQKAGERIGVTNSELIDFVGDGQAVMAYDELTDRVPHLTGLVALAEEQSRLVEIGRTPGSGTVTYVYDDGYVHHEKTVKITFSRLDLSVTAKGVRSENSRESYITEYIRFEVTLTNPNPESDFIGRTPVAITLTKPVDETDGSAEAENESFYTAYGLDVMTGAAAASTHNSYTETKRLVLTPCSSNETFGWPPPGIFDFLVSPKRDGEHLFHFTVENDPDIAPKRIPMTVQLPPLGFGEDFEANSPIVANSWMDIRHRDMSLEYHVSVLDLAMSQTIQGFAQNDLPHWTIIGPKSTVRIPVTNRSTSPSAVLFPFMFREPGAYTVRLGLTDRPEIRSEDLQIRVVPPATVKEAAKNPLESSGVVIPETNQWGTLQVVSPSKHVAWVKDVPIPVRIQTYGGQGNPKAIGRTLTATYINTSDPSLTYSSDPIHEVLGVDLWAVSGAPPFKIDGQMFPSGGGGLIAFDIVPLEDASGGRDIIFKFTPARHRPDEFGGGLPTEQSVYIDGEFSHKVPTGGIAFGIADFVESKDDSYLFTHMLISGRGVAADPRQIPVATQRVRDLAERADLPKAVSPDVKFDVLGTAGFTDSLASGLDAAKTDLGEGLNLIPEKTEIDIENGKLVVAARTELNAPLGDRQISFTFNDGQTWVGSLELFGTDLKVPEDHRDKNLPLNARYHGEHPKGCQIFYAEPWGDTVGYGSGIPKLELELVPSLMPGDTQRGVETPNPLVGFKRSIDLETGEARISEITSSLFQIHNRYFSVYGDITDRRSIDPEKGSGLLGDPGNPDFYADFVSGKKDSEQLILKLEGNVVDCLLFTAYNFVATIQENLSEPGLDFAELMKQQPSIDEAYSVYSRVDTDRSVSSLTESETEHAVAAYVDHEAAGWNLDWERDRLKHMAEADFFAGILDQFYGWTGRTYPRVEWHYLARDGRVRPFGGDDRNPLARVPTGAGRVNFGIDLDGVLYDPMILGIDEPPNGGDLLTLPVVTNTSLWKAEEMENGIPQPQEETHLLPRIGGTSGGYFDLDRRAGGRHFVVAKTPGQEFPGLHAGYLIEGKPEDLTDPYSGSVEDDIRDVIVKRDPNSGRLVREEVVLGIRQDRGVLAFARNDDYKQLTQTAARTTAQYLVTTDPPGIEAPVKAALLIRELPSDPEDSVSLLVTTQSMGSEKTLKIILDNLSDLAIDIVATVVLTALTEGEYVAACGGEIAGDISTALVNFGVGMLESEYLESSFEFDQASKSRVNFMNGVLNDGVEVGGGTGVKVSAGDLLEFEGKNFRVGTVKTNVSPGIPFCALLKAPFEKLKSAIKDSFSVEDLGGNGSAEAFGMKTLAVCIPQSAWRGDGLYSAEFSTSRRIDIQPKESFMRELSDWSFFDLDPAEVSDLDLIHTVMRYTSDADHGREADVVLKRMAIQSIHREPGEAYDDVYEDYKLRFSRVPSIQAILVPGAVLGNTMRMGDWEFTSGKTKVAVSSGSVVTVSRSNENAGARAALVSPGYEMILINAMIPAAPMPPMGPMPPLPGQ